MKEGLQVRRVVTGQVNGRGVLISDGPTPCVFPIGSGMVLTNIWMTKQSPAPLANASPSPDDEPLALKTPANGTVFRLTDFPPEPEGGVDATRAAEIFSSFAPSGFTKADKAESDALMTSAICYG
ncbi:MAG: hypothetical protein ABW034_10200 [Steroidobacteraceae bacterium]